MFELSIVIPTRDRPEDLSELLNSIATQDKAPLEIIIVDDSSSGSSRSIVTSFSKIFNSINCVLKYVKGTSEGLPSARNLGIAASEGDAVFFLDDDTILYPNIISCIENFFLKHPEALGVQTEIVSLNGQNGNELPVLTKTLYKAMMLGYYDLNKMLVRRSGSSVFPSVVTKVIPAQRLSGCCCCYRRVVFKDHKFDTKLKLWGFMEDLDFSYRVYKNNPHSLYVIPYSKIIHKTSKKARMPNRNIIFMTTTYWVYIFFKDIFDASVINLLAFLWGLTCSIVVTTTKLVIERKSRSHWWSLIYMLQSYAFAFRNLKSILQYRLDFFNDTLKG